MTPFVQAHGFWEASETRFLRDALHEGMTFIDVGANTGYFSVLGSRLVGATGRVFAVEPERRNIAVLKANLWRHGCDNAVILPIAAHRQRGFLPLRLNDENRGDHQVGWSDEASALVPSARLDDLLAGVSVDVAKVDTQGVDHDVIDGLSGLFPPDRRPRSCASSGSRGWRSGTSIPMRCSADISGLASTSVCSKRTVRCVSPRHPTSSRPPPVGRVSTVNVVLRRG